MSRPSRSGWRSAAVIAAMVALSGCAQTRGDQHLLDFLQDGTTTRETALLRLGEPSAAFENGRIVTYRINQDDAGYMVTSAREKWWSGKFSLVLSFNDNGVLQKHSLVSVK